MLKKRFDSILFGTIILLVILGFVVLAGVSMTLSQRNFGHPFHYLLRQVTLGFIPGIILGFLAYKINLQFLKKISFPLFFAVLVLLALVLIPEIGVFRGGARRWLSLGPITFQPSEFLKLIFIVYLSAWLAKHKQKKEPNKPLRLFLLFLIMIIIISALLIAQPDISTLVVIIAVACIIYFVSGTPLYQTGILIFGGIGALAFLIKTAPYRLERLLTLIRPGTEILGSGFQIKQSLIAIGSGGMFGQGLGLSIQKFGFLPQPMTDTIFAVFAEETGFIGALILVLLFLIFAWQGFKVAKNSSDLFLKLLATGITSWIIIQAFINIGAIIGILPLTGIPLPFISYGSSHLLVELVGVGILLNVSKHRKKRCQSSIINN